MSRGGKKSLTPEQLDGIITQSKSQGSYFFGILGGEPLMYRGLFDVLEKHPDCYFQIFTNATLITPELAQHMRKLGNVTPLISIEGLREESDRRRGKDDVYERTLRGLVKIIAESGKEYAVANITGAERTLTLRPGVGTSTDVRLIINARMECPPEYLDQLVRNALVQSINGRYTDEVLAWRYLQPGRPNPTHRFSEVVA